MKILYYSPHPLLKLSAPAGYGTHMREMISAFRTLGHEVVPLIMGDAKLPVTGSTPTRDSMKSRIKSWIPWSIWSSLKDLNVLRFDRYAARALQARIETIQPDLIYERAAYLQNSGVRVASETGIHHILEMNAPYTEEHVALNGSSLVLPKAGKIELQQLHQTDRICVVSSALQAYFINKHGIGREKFLLTPNAVDPKKLKVDPAKADAIRKRYGLNRQYVVGFVGSIFPWHGVGLLVSAFHKIAQPKMKLIIVGDGETLPKIRDQVVHAGIGDRVVFTGNVPHEEVFSYLEIMNVTVLANSHWYGSPVKIFEYGAMGKAIIAPDNIPVRDVMENGKDGILVSAKTDELAAAISKLYEDPALSTRLANHFQRKVLNQYIWSRVAENILS